MTNVELTTALRKPFDVSEIEWRVQRSGMNANGPWAMVLAYVTNRAIMYRLDGVCGIEGWQNEFKQLADGSYLCGIGVDINAQWIWKWDGASKTDIEATKGGISSAMKRTAVQWGIGRYLYYLEAGWADFHPKGTHKAKIDNQYYSWDAPALPAWAIPEAPIAPEKMEDIVY